MYVPLLENERKALFNQNRGCHIPGYTGHCPTLRFQYGHSYGSETCEILKDLRDRDVIKRVNQSPYRQNNSTDRENLPPIMRSKGQVCDERINNYRDVSPKYIIGYTGFIPTLSFQYGESYGKAANDSMYKFNSKEKVFRNKMTDYENMRVKSAPKSNSIRYADEVNNVLKEKELYQPNNFKGRVISPEYPPISGYTGYLGKVKGNEESLSQGYNKVVRRSLTLMREEKDTYNRDIEKQFQYLRSLDDKYEKNIAKNGFIVI